MVLQKKLSSNFIHAWPFNLVLSQFFMMPSQTHGKDISFAIFQSLITFMFIYFI